MTCSIEGCERAAYCRGWCQRHYYQMNRWGEIRRTKFDPNEFRIFGDVAEMDVYDLRGNVTGTFLVDAEIVPKLQIYKWNVAGAGYAVLSNGHVKKQYLHRFVLGDVPDGHIRVVDHINGNIRDNRRANLRLVPMRANIRNSRKGKNGNRRGVTRVGERWIANISVVFDTEEEALAMREKWEEVANWEILVPKE